MLKFSKQSGSIKTKTNTKFKSFLRLTNFKFRRHFIHLAPKSNRSHYLISFKLHRHFTAHFST